MRRKRQKKDAFTLVELLIVITIIGLLATLILVYVAQSRQEAKDGNIRANLSQVRGEAAIIYSEDESYIGVDNELCSGGTLNSNNPNHPVLGVIKERVERLNGGKEVECYANNSSYCVQSPLISGGAFCVDAEGKATSEETNCSNTNKKCSAP